MKSTDREHAPKEMRNASAAVVAALTGATSADQRPGAGLRSAYAAARRRLSYVEPMLPDDSERANGVRGELACAAARFLRSFSEDFASAACV